VETNCHDKICIVLPSLDPDAKFSGVLKGLVDEGFQHIVVIDDGSSPEHQSWFTMAEQYSVCTVLRHEVNKGKGRALKDAFRYVLDNMPEVTGVVTIDGDGQHLLKYIIACAEDLIANPDCVVLGCRDFSLPGIPPRSVAGNRTTSAFFNILFGIRLSDTQTGLRAIPYQYLLLLCEVEGERFEYETNMLLTFKRHKIRWLERSIATVYDPEDYSSHYNAVKDSARIAKVMLRYIFSSKK